MSDSEDRRTSRRGIDLAGSEGVDARLVALIVLVTGIGIGHHLDHVVRGNHVGWPLAPEVTMFTYSLLFYPLIAIGLYLTLTERAGARYWLLVTVAGFAVVAGSHFGPFAVEPPGDVTGPYESAVVGYLALAWLLGLVGSLLAAVGYAAYRWRTRGAPA